MDPILTVSAGTLASIMEFTPKLFSDLVLIVAVAVGFPLAFWVIRKAISLVRVR